MKHSVETQEGFLRIHKSHLDRAIEQAPKQIAMIRSEVERLKWEYKRFENQIKRAKEKGYTEFDAKYF
jgi:predicted  nucleic acid-binding Zn-ribbon protein